ncbi:MAG: ribosomal RNA small subunit methyltransferase A, partial [Chlamydiia bacterium]|nr:ribosomal RNA small subunit methyltransferase A [Chlamydiia bacterium]
MRRLYQASTLLDFLHSVGVRPKKGLSQNFLVDGNVVSKIVDAAGVCEGDLILEIGRGPGVLTEEILLRGASVLAIEKDRVLGPALQRLCEDTDRLTVITGDALEQDFAALLKQKLKPGQRAKVVANLPYQITTPLLVALAPLTDSVSDIVVMVQDEFARRATASPGSREIGSLTIFLEYYSDCR